MMDIIIDYRLLEAILLIVRTMWKHLIACSSSLSSFAMKDCNQLHLRMLPYQDRKERFIDS